MARCRRSRTPAGLRTPALVVDFDVVTSNVERMGSLLARRDIALRPHVKTHKSPDLARLQLAHGAAGITVATVGEASVFAANGFEDIFVAYPVWADAATARLVRLILDTARLAVGIDSEASLGALLDRLPEVRGRLDLMIEIDCGQHRTGVNPDAVVSLARACHEAGFAPRGVFTHGGHCYGGPGLVAGAAADEVRALTEAKDRLGAADLPCEVVSAGSTPTVGRSGTGAVTEERPGVYVFNDRQQLILGSCTDEQIGAVVVTRVVSTSVADRIRRRRRQQGALERLTALGRGVRSGEGGRWRLGDPPLRGARRGGVPRGEPARRGRSGDDCPEPHLLGRESLRGNGRRAIRSRRRPLARRRPPGLRAAHVRSWRGRARQPAVVERQ